MTVTDCTEYGHVVGVAGHGEVVSVEAKIPPLTPRTRQKMSQAVLDTFKSFDKEQQRLGIPKGNTEFLFFFIFLFL